MSLLNDYAREVRYNRQLKLILKELGLPSLIMYTGAGRIFEVQGVHHTYLISTVPLPDQQVNLVLVLTGTHQAVPIKMHEDQLSTQLYKLLKEEAHDRPDAD